MEKFGLFLENAIILKSEFNIIPLLYGSLGLEVLTGIELNSDDIDILISKRFVTGENWTEFRAYLESLGYILTDEHEHTFQKDNISYSYACIEELKDFVGIEVQDVPKHECKGIEYMRLSAQQYLKVYKRSAQDGYRINVKEKQDKQKIELIADFIRRVE